MILNLRTWSTVDNNDKEDCMQFSQEQLDEVLAKHKKWLDGEDGGDRAHLSGADLSYADLSRADLSYADLSYADLRFAKLYCAKLVGANLSHAFSLSTDLRNVDLSHADITGADMDYSSWPLWCGSLRVKADEAICAQLAYHLARLMENSGLAVGDEVRNLANRAKQIEEYGLPPIS